MSTKIYGGYTFSKMKNINAKSFLNNIENVKTQIFALQIDSILKDFYIDFIHYSKYSTLSDMPDSNFNSSWTKTEDDLSLVVFPSDTNKTYCMLFGNQKENLLLTKALKLKSFEYYNNTDRPDNISRKNWKKRDDTWAAVLNDYNSTPNEAGLTFRFYSSIFNITQNDFEMYLKKNTEELKLEIYKNNFFKKYTKEEKYSKIIKDFKKISQEQIEKETSKIKLRSEFKFTGTDDNCSDNIEMNSMFQTLDNNITLSNLIKTTNNIAEKRIDVLHDEMLLKYNDCEEYLDSGGDRSSELVSVYNSDHGFDFGIKILEKEKHISRIITGNRFSVFKEINRHIVAINSL